MTSENKKEKVKKKVWFAENVKLPAEAGMLCTIDGKYSICSPRTRRLEILASFATSQMTKPVSTKSPKSTSCFKEAWTVYWPSKRKALHQCPTN